MSVNAVWRPFKNDVTANMPNFRPPSPFVTVRYFFHYTPPPHVIRQTVTNFFLDKSPSKIILHILYN